MHRSFLPQLPPELEREFQAQYYDRIRPTLRVMAPLLAALFAACAVRDYADTGSLSQAAAQDGIPALFFLAAFALTWAPAFGRLWQPVLAVGGLATAVVSLGAMAAFLGGSAHELHAGPPGGGPPSGRPLLFGLQVCLLMVCLTVLRLRFRWALALQAGVFAAGVWAFSAHLAAGHGPGPGDGLLNFLRPVVAILAAVLLAALVNEQLSASAFVANHLLAEERNDERRRREQTEKTLHVLSQAIGGIVHDLGNPLTAVQAGAETLDVLLDGDTDPAILREMTDAIGSGARMLNYLRLSLIEQTRVLEGKPTPVDVRPVALRRLIEAGAQFQKPYQRGGRPILIEGPDVQVCADEMKTVTVFMNLIGNALKYSDGEVRIVWRGCGDPEPGRDPMLAVAVLDRGLGGRGITRAQASQLFQPFGRLEAHAAIEGTGLGLLSVQKIVAAQGGETFIQGYEDGTSTSPVFSTAQGSSPLLLTAEARTAFVVTCPLAR